MSLRRRVTRATFYGASAAVIAWAAYAVPLPYVEYVPGPTTSIEPLVEIHDAEVTELDGDSALLTILVRDRSVLQTLTALLDEDRELRPYDEVYPEDLDRDELRIAERERFGRQFEIAAAVGAREAGVEVELVTEVVVVQVVANSPADGLLEPGDVITEVHGDELPSAEELRAITQASEPGDELILTIVRDGEEQQVTATLGDVLDDGQARLGVGVETALDELRLPLRIELAEDTRIGGPSAGLMVAVTVYDLLADEDLLAGRTVVGTGTVDPEGRVGPVGGVPQKMVAAHDYGADLVLVPASQLQIAQANAPEGLSVVGVATLEEALEALRRDPV